MGIKHFMCLNMRGAAITSSNIFTITGVIIPMGQTFYMYNLLLNIHINSLPWVVVASRELMLVSLLFGNFSVFTCLLRQDSLCLATWIRGIQRDPLLRHASEDAEQGEICSDAPLLESIRVLILKTRSPPRLPLHCRSLGCR